MNRNISQPKYDLLAFRLVFANLYKMWFPMDLDVGSVLVLEILSSFSEWVLEFRSLKKMKPTKFCTGKDEKKSNKENGRMHSDTILIMLLSVIVEQNSFTIIIPWDKWFEQMNAQLKTQTITQM